MSKNSCVISKILCYFAKYRDDFVYSKNVPKKPSFLKRDLDARAHSEAYRIQFRLPAVEKLDGSIDATIWTPYNKRHVWGKIFLSQNYLCFESRVSRFASAPNISLFSKELNTCFKKKLLTTVAGKTNG